MSERTLTHQTVVGIAWSWGSVVLNAVLQLVYTAIMARLLLPSDYGVLGSALILLRLVDFVAKLGLASAVVQRPQLQPRDISSTFLTVIFAGTLSVTILFFGAPLISTAFNQPRLEAVLRWTLVAMFAGCVSAIPEAMLRRAMRFRVLAQIQIASFVVGSMGFGLGFAAFDMGVWSLVAAQVAQSTLAALLCMFAARIPLRTGFHIDSVRPLVQFGSKVSFTSILEAISASIDTFAVSRYLGAASLGQYSRATLLVGLPVEQMTTATSRVLLPGLSRIQTESDRYQKAVTTSMGLAAMVISVSTMMIAISAPALVAIVLGPGWDSAAEVLPLVAIAYGLALLTNGAGIAAEARGALKQKILIQVLSIFFTLTLVSLVVATGPTLMRLGAAWAMGEIFRHGLYWVIALPHLGVKRRLIARWYLRAFVFAAVASLPMSIVVRLVGQRDFWAVLLAGIVGLVCLALAVASPIGSQLRVTVGDVRNRLTSDERQDTSEL